MKNKLSKLENLLIIILLLSIIFYFVFLTINSFFKKGVETIKFEITGIVDSINATTLTQVHFECIKFCVNQIGDGSLAQKDCWKECSTLGKENLK